MKRGEIYLVNLDPVLGSETGKIRPAIVLQNDLANRSSPTVTVVPLTSNLDRCHPFQVLLPAAETGLSKDSKALCEQIRTVARQRLGSGCIGKLSAARLAQVRTALDRHLWFAIDSP
jgi:mRNA interferase MazF